MKLFTFKKTSLPTKQRGAASLLPCLIISYTVHAAIKAEPKIYREAVCILQGINVTGTIYFKQESLNGPTRIFGEVAGLVPGSHGMHIHEFGNMLNACELLGGHYNPLKKNHGYPNVSVTIFIAALDTRNRHIGDLGNIEVNRTGIGEVNSMNNLVSLGGPYSVIGRSFDIHENEDDLGNDGNAQRLKNGNGSADSVACCVIGLKQPK
ncbi:unnamed protein product [Soboliphyme baturini]|uniref:Superoxide dismutase n=1 Tax=Soboliphyme baturini TaxID=241478 RepID=A0A183IEN1_9BILA|nr:unnamed protein product [Soboliphyme baturini]